MTEKIRILIAEDDKNIRQLYSIGLPDATFEKTVVEDGQAAFDTYEPGKFEIVLLDIMMPVKSGFQALKEIRAKERLNSLKPAIIIMATSLNSKDDIMDCLKEGIQGYIVKPFKVKELTAKIIEFYNKAHGEQK